MAGELLQPWVLFNDPAQMAGKLLQPWVLVNGPEQMDSEQFSQVVLNIV